MLKETLTLQAMTEIDLKIVQMVNLTKCETEIASKFLSKCDFNLELALNRFYNFNGDVDEFLKSLPSNRQQISSMHFQDLEHPPLWQLLNNKQLMFPNKYIFSVINFRVVKNSFFFF